VAKQSRRQITITITGNSLTLQSEHERLYETTFTLPAETNPQQLRRHHHRLSANE